MVINLSVTPEDIKELSLPELIQLNIDTLQLRFGEVKKEDIKFYIVTRVSPKRKVENDTEMNTLKPFKFIIHGWIENSRRHWYDKITVEFLKKDDLNVIHVDWESTARSAYISSASNTKLVGKEL